MKLTSRLTEPGDAQTYVEWSRSTALNLWDPSIVEYPSLRTLAILENGNPVLFAPFHPVLLVESLAHKPGITSRENAVALRKLQDDLEMIARTYNMSEIYWQCDDPTLIKFAVEHGGYTVVPTRVLRKRIVGRN